MPDIPPDIQKEELDLGYECHDCGEIYAPGASFNACTNAGHYVGKIETCALPFITPATKE
jgi:hypothetical protein